MLRAAKGPQCVGGSVHLGSPLPRDLLPQLMLAEPCLLCTTTSQHRLPIALLFLYLSWEAWATLLHEVCVTAGAYLPSACPSHLMVAARDQNSGFLSAVLPLSPIQPSGNIPHQGIFTCSIALSCSSQCCYQICQSISFLIFI